MTANKALAEAIEAGDVSQVRQLIEQDPTLVNAPGWTPPPLHCAVLWNAPSVAETLLDGGADLELKDPDRQTTPVRYAIVYCRPQMVRLLVARGAHCGAIAAGGLTAMQLAEAGLAGTFEDFDDTPPRADYSEIINVLSELGIT